MILAFNTSLADLHIGLFSDEAIPLAEFHHKTSADERGIHDALLAQKTFELMSKGDQSVAPTTKDISSIVFIKGPGSFTGLRIGLAFAKGMAFGSGAVLVPLIAHTVLLKSLEKSHSSDSRHSFPILYPGYAKDSVYVSYSDEPEKVTYMQISDLLKTGITECICPPELAGIEIPHHIVEISLQTMAEMASSRSDFSPTISLADLEPFYGTDFKPTV